MSPRYDAPVHPRLQNALLNGGLLLGSLSLFLAAGEIALRVTGIEKGKVVPPPIYVRSDDPQISYALKPHLRERAFRSVITTNSLGLRSPEPDGERPVIAVLGDSITFGYGVQDNESLPARLQALLPGYDVQNGAVPGYNLMQESATYARSLSPLAPEALVLVFYWNDLADMDPAVLHQNGNLYPPGVEPSPEGCAPVTEGLLGLVPGKCWLDTHSALYRVMKKLVIARTEKRNQAEQVQELAAKPDYEYVPEDRVARYAAELTEFAETLPQDMPRLFVIWPERPLHTALRPRLKALAEQNGFAVLDLYDVFGNDAPTLSWDTVHPNAETLARAAKEVHEALTPLLPR